MKNNYFFYNSRCIARQFVPKIFWSDYKKIIKDWEKRDDAQYIKNRLNYYCRLESKCDLETKLKETNKIKDLSILKNIHFTRFCKNKTVYNFDSYEILKHFNKNLRANFAFGDVNAFLCAPSITKSRPIESNADSNLNANSTLLNLEKIRHFIFINDPIDFRHKKNILFYRGAIYQPHRIAFFKKHFNNPRCDLGHTGKNALNPSWQKPKINIKAHLPYKFLLSLEGNDVASNLKWILSSNSLCIAPKMKFETWFMEGKLEPNIHYAKLSSDYENLDEILDFYIKNENAAQKIIKNAHDFCAQFSDKKREKIIAILVLEKYFRLTNQGEFL